VNDDSHKNKFPPTVKRTTQDIVLFLKKITISCVFEQVIHN